MTDTEIKVIKILMGKKKPLTEEELKEQRRKYNESVKRAYRLKKKGDK